MLQGHYISARRAIAAAKEFIGDRRSSVVSVTVQSGHCKQTYPCQHTGGIVFTFDDGSTMNMSINRGVSIGAIMKYFTPDDINPHFGDYVEDRDVSEL